MPRLSKMLVTTLCVFIAVSETEWEIRRLVQLSGLSCSTFTLSNWAHPGLRLQSLIPSDRRGVPTLAVWVLPATSCKWGGTEENREWKNTFKNKLSRENSQENAIICRPWWKLQHLHNYINMCKLNAFLFSQWEALVLNILWKFCIIFDSGRSFLEYVIELDSWINRLKAIYICVFFVPYKSLLFCALLSTLSTLRAKPLFYLTSELLSQWKQFLVIKNHSFFSKNIT